MLFELRPAEEVVSTPSVSPSQIFDVADKEIVAVEVRSPDGRVAFRRSAALQGDWEMTFPQPAAVDQVVVNGNASRLGRLRATRVLTGLTDLAEVGLEAPRLAVTLTLTNSRQLQLWVGDVNPTSTASYARRGDEDTIVFLVDQFVVEELQRLITQAPVLAGETPPSPQ